MSHRVAQFPTQSKTAVTPRLVKNASCLAQVATLFSSVGKDDFMSALHRLFAQVAGFEDFLVAAFRANEAPRGLYFHSVNSR